MKARTVPVFTAWHIPKSSPCTIRRIRSSLDVVMATNRRLGPVATTSATDTLAIDGGTPVRTSFPPMGKGVSLFDDEEREAVLAVLESRSLFRYYGPELLKKVEAFEEASKALLGASHAVATSSGTAALRAALAALGVGCGDEVILPSLTFIASVNAVVVAGAVPVFAEIDDTLGLDPEDVAAKITDRTTAIMPVHLDNGACDMDPLMEVARREASA